MYCPAMPQMYSPMDEEDNIMGFSIQYPKVYYKIYPRIKMLCQQMDLPANPSMYPCPSTAVTQQMTDNIYNALSKEDIEEIESCIEESDRQLGFGGRRLLRDLIQILLIRELIRRRRRPFPFPYSNYYTYPGMGPIY